MGSFLNEVLSALMWMVSCFGLLGLLAVIIYLLSSASLILGKSIKSIRAVKMVKQWVVRLLEVFEEIIGRLGIPLVVLLMVLSFSVIPWFGVYGLVNPKSLEAFLAYAVAALIISIPSGVIFLVYFYMKVKKADEQMESKNMAITAAFILWGCLTWLPALLVITSWVFIQLFVGRF